jgi:hypothetical protein
MHEIALEPKEFYQLWADGSSAGIEEVDLKLKSRNHIYALLNSVYPCRAVNQPVGGS